MKKTACYIAIALLPILSSFAGDWFKYSSPDKAFHVLFPVEPKETEQKLQTAVGELIFKIYTSSASNNEAYMVMTTDYPELSKIHSDADEELLAKVFRGGVDGALQNLGNAQLLSEEDIKLDNYPGKEIKASFMGGEGFIHARIYLVNNRMYMIQIVGAKEAMENWDVTRYMESFQLTKW